ncbi:hypothetical protein CEY16_07935 [Halalkalibacillus sediminis]|uniref:C4-dicarboxylate ABC transporter n=1 Tax=Halalkalibacillus sediminis TaxID=2018042 RepID=A0A2I0QUT1_9BACI|nr:hypothetical protein [Halalkalibacillus sediminis]PKR77850.1 hypothetical protein CEY16_07935 [Halalkalibacillus sediminis]
MKPVIFRPLSTLLMGFTYLLSQFVDHPFLPVLVSVFAATTILSFVPYLGKVPRILISTLLILSAILFFQNGSWSAVGEGLRSNVGLLAIFIFVPLLSLPIQSGKYLDYMETIFNHYIKTSRKLYLYLKMTLMGVGSVVNLGTIPIMYQLTNTPSLESYEKTRLKAMNRGFSLSFMWSPYFISLALILSYFDVTWIQLFPFGISMAIIGLLLGVVMEGRLNHPIEITENQTDAIPIKKAQRKLIELVIIIVSMTAVTMTIEYNVDLSVITIIPVIAIIISTGWSLFYQSIQSFGKELLGYTQNRLPKMGNELSLFIAAGCFGVAILNAGASEWIIYSLQASGITHVLVLIPILAIVINALSFVGIHPIITITAMAITLSSTPIFEGDHLVLSLGLLSSWMVTVMASPFSATNLMIASLVNSNSVKIGLKLNGLYALVLWMIFYLIIVGLYFVL